MFNRFQFENKSVPVMLINDGLVSMNASLVLTKGLCDTRRVSWLVSMNDAFVLMNDAFVRMSDALVRMNASFVRTKRAAGYRLQVTGYRLQVTGCRVQVTGCRVQVTECALQAAVREVFNQLRTRILGSSGNALGDWLLSRQSPTISG
jgi:hypothetical protein